MLKLNTQGSGIQNWDAVGYFGDNLLLVEAKAHIKEIKSNCQAKPNGGRNKIIEALNETKEKLGINQYNDWLKEYYQYANRIAVLYFLRKYGVNARLVFIYFTGDRKFTDAPANKKGWEKDLGEQDKYLGLSKKHKLSEYIHKIFLPVCPNKLV